MSGGLRGLTATLRLRGRLGRALALAGPLMVLVGGGAVALATRDGTAMRQLAGAPAGASTTVARPATTAATAATTTTTTTAPPETTTTTEAPPVQASESVREMQQRLADLGYDIGPIDGLWGPRTYYTVQAFQKVEGLARTGEDSAALRAALATASRPGPMVPGGAANRVEVDLDRQVLFLWQGGALARILPVSTGNGVASCENGMCGDALTPTGSFRIGRKAAGLEVSPLGQLWSPSYFYGGIAFHGSPSIPPYPASHGCVRIPMYAHESFFDQTPSGMAVYVVGDGPAASEIPPPPDAPVVPTEPVAPPPDDVPTTTVPPAPAPEPEPEPTTTTTPPLTAPDSGSATTTTRTSG
jgi:peptidoglycan hydrolase-like protein with peptidoglycan-binding domain